MADREAQMAGVGPRCDRCGETFKHLSWLARHEARKTPCVSTLECDGVDHDPTKPSCEHCGRQFSAYTNMRRHVRSNCKAVRAHATPAAPAPYIVTINAFGQEAIDHLGMAEIVPIYEDALPLAGDPAAAVWFALGRVASLIYCDPAHPENLTCSVSSKRGATALVSRGAAGHAPAPVADVLPIMAAAGFKKLAGNRPRRRCTPGFDAIFDEMDLNVAKYSCGRGMRPVLDGSNALLSRLFEAKPRAGDGPAHRARPEVATRLAAAAAANRRRKEREAVEDRARDVRKGAHAAELAANLASTMDALTATLVAQDESHAWWAAYTERVVFAFSAVEAHSAPCGVLTAAAGRARRRPRAREEADAAYDAWQQVYGMPAEPAASVKSGAAAQESKCLDAAEDADIELLERLIGRGGPAMHALPAVRAFSADRLKIRESAEAWRARAEARSARAEARRASRDAESAGDAAGGEAGDAAGDEAGDEAGGEAGASTDVPPRPLRPSLAELLAAVASAEGAVEAVPAGDLPPLELARALVAEVAARVGGALPPERIVDAILARAADIGPGDFAESSRAVRALIHHTVAF